MINNSVQINIINSNIEENIKTNEKILQEKLDKISLETKENMIKLLVRDAVTQCDYKNKCSRCLGFYCLFELYERQSKLL